MKSGALRGILILYVISLCVVASDESVERAGDHGSQPFQDSVYIEQSFQKGKAAFTRGDYPVANKFAEELLTKYPEDARGYRLRAQLRVAELQDYEGAVADLEVASKLSPEAANIWGMRGWYLILLGRFEEARVATENAHRLAPDVYVWTVNLGHTYLLQESLKKAEHWYREALAQIPDQEALTSGPLADFELFVERGWMVKEAQEKRSWFQQRWFEWQSIEALNKKAILYYGEERYQEAIPIAEENVVRMRSLLGDDHAYLADYIGGLAFLLYTTGRYGEAEPLYQEALAIRRQALPAGHPDIALSLNNLASLFKALGRYGEAEPLYQEALALRRQALPAGHPDIAVSLNNLAGLLKASGRYDEAEPLYQEALALLRQVLPAGHPNIALSLNNLASLLETTGRYGEAEPLYREALALRRQALPAGHPDIAVSLNNLAGLLKASGRYDEAEPLYQEALALLRQALPAGHPDIAVSLNNLASLLETTGRYGEAEPLLREALALLRQALPAGHPDIASILNGLAILLGETGRYGEAEPLYRKALALRRQALPAGHPDIASSLNSLAALLTTTGRYGEAEPLLREALDLRRQALPAGHPDIALSLSNLASLLETTGRYGEAEPLYREALALLRQALPVGHPDIAQSLNNLASLLQSTGRYGEAEPLYREALDQRRQALPAGHPDIAQSLNNLANLFHNIDRYGEAELLYREALAIADQAGSPEALWTVQGNLGSLYAKQERLSLAIFFGKQAVNTLQAVRSNLAVSEQTTQHAFLKSKEYYYKNLADQLIDQGRLPEAQQVLTMLKEQEYFDFTRRDATADSRRSQSAYNGFEQELLDAYRQTSGKLAALGVEYRKLLAVDAFNRTPEQDQQISVLNGQLDQAYQAFRETLDMIRAGFATLSLERQKELAERQQLKGKDDRGLVRDLGLDVALVHYVVTEDRLHLLLTLPDVLLARQSWIGEVELNRQVEALRAALQDPGKDPLPAAQRLYDKLIKPIIKDLEVAGTHTLMVSLDGALRYLPLAALHDGEEYLSERLALSVFTDVARENIKLSSASGVREKGIGLGVSMAHEGFNPLPKVPEELNSIIRDEAQNDPNGVLLGRYFLDAEFTAGVLRKALTYPVLHVASHFSLNPGNESMSYLLLGDGSHLQLRQIRDDNYDFGSVDLVTLSACETAVSGQNAKGQEVDGLGTLVQKQGAKSVIATLWPVADESTGRFMQIFYRLRQEQGLSKAEALRRTQLLFLNKADNQTGIASSETEPGGDSGLERAGMRYPGQEEKRQTSDYSHPYYWAPFILMGNWL